MSRQDNLHGVSPAMSWLYLGAGELFPLHHPCRLICTPLLNLPPSLLETCKTSINRRKRMEVVETSKLTAPVSNTNPWALHQLPGSCPPAMMPPAQGPQGLQPSPSYKTPKLQSWGPSFFQVSPRQTLLPTHSCYHPSRIWILNPGLEDPGNAVLALGLPRGRIIFHRCSLLLP